MEVPLMPFEFNLDPPSEFPETFKTEYKSELKEWFEKSIKEAQHDSYVYMWKQMARVVTERDERLFKLIVKFVSFEQNNAPGHSQDLATSHHPSSEILGASVNCSLRAMMKNVKDMPEKQISDAQKENTDCVPPIFSCDFNSDIDEGNIPRYRSPSRTPTKLSPVKSQNSPILSKRKKPKSKKSGSSSSNTSSTSVSSNNDSKINASNLAPNVAKAFQEMDLDSSCVVINSDVEETNKQPLKTIENTSPRVVSKANNNEKIASKVLGMSNIKYGRSEFLEKGKKLRQTTLTLKKQPPVVDLGSMDVDVTIDPRVGNASLTAEHHQEIQSDVVANHGSDQILQKVSNKPQDKIPETRDNLLSQSDTSKNDDPLTNDPDIINVSLLPSPPSKRRNKLSLKPGLGKLKIKSPCVINSETKTKSGNLHPPTECVKAPEHEKRYESGVKESHNQKSGAELEKVQKVAVLEKRKSFEPSTTMNDETFFSPFEHAKNRDEESDYDIDLSAFEKEFQEVKTPPAKRMLMSNFDIIPRKSGEPPEFAYKEGPVRKKIDKANLPGQGCRECDKWWSNVPEEERTKIKNQCSKHRAKFRTDVFTPESFWNPVIDYSFDSSIDES
ncbi:hypothetical protein QAD02_015828 [Eretmocerus hayati]|uniref:Uncharacterized protein n=1 Tax=Eretmocerus hayati TaxID=131215 RepID=A0ACC2PAL0_9HYME|nr:hypothetical protein QAD02_015828 [Eretmocerus hayati]